MSAIIAGSMVLSWAKYSEFGVSWGSLAPFIGAAIAILVLGEGITRPLIVATGLMILGVGLCLSEQLYDNLQNTSRRKSGKEPPDSPPPRK